jgi:mannosyltransferase
MAAPSVELIPTEHWEIPDWIDPTKLNNSIRNMELKGVKYASELSYHQMCRWFSGFFYRHPALNDIRYYWRVEPNVKSESSPLPLPLQALD